MGLWRLKVPTKEQVASELRQQRKQEVREIAIALLQGGYQGTDTELISDAKAINDALNNI